MKYLPDFKFTPFDEALKESVDWFVQVRRISALLISVTSRIVPHLVAHEVGCTDRTTTRRALASRSSRHSIRRLHSLGLTFTSHGPRVFSSASSRAPLLSPFGQTIFPFEHYFAWAMQSLLFPHLGRHMFFIAHCLYLARIPVCACAESDMRKE